MCNPDYDPNHTVDYIANYQLDCMVSWLLCSLIVASYTHGVHVTLL